MQAAGIKTCRFALFTKPFLELKCCKFENCVLESFYELFYDKVFIFQCFE